VSIFFRDQLMTFFAIAPSWDTAASPEVLLHAAVLDRLLDARSLPETSLLDSVIAFSKIDGQHSAHPPQMTQMKDIHISSELSMWTAINSLPKPHLPQPCEGSAPWRRQPLASILTPVSGSDALEGAGSVDEGLSDETASWDTSSESLVNGAYQCLLDLGTSPLSPLDNHELSPIKPSTPITSQYSLFDCPALFNDVLSYPNPQYLSIETTPGTSAHWGESRQVTVPVKDAGVSSSASARETAAASVAAARAENLQLRQRLAAARAGMDFHHRSIAVLTAARQQLDGHLQGLLFQTR